MSLQTVSRQPRPAAIPPLPGPAPRPAPPAARGAARSRPRFRRGWIGSALLLSAVAAAGAGLAAWKQASLAAAAAEAASQPESVEVVTAAVAMPRTHRPTTTAIGTVLALRSVTLRNELPGTVREVALTPGDVVEPGALLVAFDVSVEQAELAAHRARAALAETRLRRMRSLRARGVAAQAQLDEVRAERDVARAEVARIDAVIARKTIRAPFRARVGLADVHPGQFLEQGTALTTLQGIAEAAHVDFAVPQRIASGLREGDRVELSTGAVAAPIAAHIVAIDSRVDPATRNAAVRARVEAAHAPAPGASVRVRVPSGRPQTALAVPVTALRQGPEGEHVFVLDADAEGTVRAALRPVRSGPVLGDEVVILDGLSPGERVAASGSFKLRPGVPVEVAMRTAARARR